MDKKKQKSNAAIAQQHYPHGEQLSSEDEDNEETSMKRLGSARPVNPTYKSQLFSNVTDEIKQFRALTGKQALKDQSYKEIFGNYQEGKPDQRFIPTSESSNLEEISVARNQNPNRMVPDSAKSNKQKQESQNQMWWDYSEVLRSNPNSQSDHQHQINKNSSNNNIEGMRKEILDLKNKKQGDQKRVEGNYNIISHSQLIQQNQPKLHNNELNNNNGNPNKQNLKTQKCIDHQLQKEEEENRKANRNYSNLFGRLHTAGNNIRNNSFLANQSVTSDKIDKEDLFLPNNVVDKLQSKKYATFDKENGDVNTQNKHLANEKLIFDSESQQKQLQKPQNKEVKAQINNLSQIKKEANSHEQPKEKKSFMRAGEEEKIIVFDIKTIKNNFDKEAFKRFCLSKGHRILIFQTASNGRNIIYLKETRKNPDPIDSLVSHLKINGAIPIVKNILGKEFNAKNFEVAAKSKNLSAARPQTGKKHFKPEQQPALKQHNLFNID